MYANEKELQDIVYNTPALLAIEPDVKVYSIACEVAVKSGRIDVLCINENGIILIVEVKLNKNIQSRREVLAQLFDYFSDIDGLSYFELNDLTGKKLGNIIDNNNKKEEFKEKIEFNLKNNGIKLIVVVDELNENLNKIIYSIKKFIKIDIDVIAIGKYENGNISKPIILGRHTFPDPKGGKKSSGNGKPLSLINDKEKLKTLIKTIGMSTFVKYYEYFSEEKYSTSDIKKKMEPEGYTKNVVNTKVSMGKRIFKERLNIDALKFILDANNVEDKTKEDAKRILTNKHDVG